VSAQWTPQVSSTQRRKSAPQFGLSSDLLGLRRTFKTQVSCIEYLRLCPKATQSISISKCSQWSADFVTRMQTAQVDKFRRGPKNKNTNTKYKIAHRIWVSEIWFRFVVVLMSFVVIMKKLLY